MPDSYNNGELVQTRAGKAIESGEQDKSEDYFDKIYVAFWDGTNYFAPKLPSPVTDRVVTDEDFKAVITKHSMRLNERIENEQTINAIRHIDGKKKYTFSFLSKKIPNPRSLFYIRGGKYICEKITATFKEEGRSLLLKGVFYRVLD